MTFEISASLVINFKNLSCAFFNVSFEETQPIESMATDCPIKAHLSEFHRSYDL